MLNEINSAKSISSYLYLSNLITLAIGFISVAAVTWFLSSNIPKFAVVDMQAVIAKQSEYLAKTHSDKVPASKIQEAGYLLKERLEFFATKNRVVLLNKGAVMGGYLPDYTESIIEDFFPNHTSSLQKMMQEHTKYRNQASSKISKLFSNIQEDKQS